MERTRDELMASAAQITAAALKSDADLRAVLARLAGKPGGLRPAAAARATYDAFRLGGKQLARLVIEALVDQDLAP